MSKEPGKGWKVAEIENTLEALQRGVGGKLEAVTLASDACILCNEEGRLLGMPYNTTICGVSFVGPLLIAGIAGEDFAGLTEQQVDRLRTLDGLVPSLYDMPEGCRFAPRCKFACPECEKTRIHLTELENGRQARCRRYEK